MKTFESIAYTFYEGASRVEFSLPLLFDGIMDLVLHGEETQPRTFQINI